MTWTLATLADSMGDCVVYRNLDPMLDGLPSLREAWAGIGLDHYYVPRKTAPEYASALMYYLNRAQKARGVSTPLQRLLFVGDTLMLDGTAARNIGRHLPLLGFIGAERLAQPPKVELQGELMVANRWAALGEFLSWVRASSLRCDERMALLLDLDKTSLGARGRNDKVIDDARVQAVHRTMQAALGDGFDAAAFRTFYDRLIQPNYHHFTADNQDYVAYVCLMVSGGIVCAEELWASLQAGQPTGFQQFVQRCEALRGQMSPALVAAHDEVRKGMEAEDPTPFKAFRRREYLETVGRMNVLQGEADAPTVLAQEIVITAEVASLAQALARLGVLVFGISDKPDEASIPTAEQAAHGYQPLHRTPMKVYGERVA